MKIFVIVGMPASGKDIVRQYAKINQHSHFSTGDIVRAEIQKRNVTGDAENTAVISDELRGQDGLGVTKIVLNEVLNSGADVVFLEGIRSWQEIEFIRSRADCVLIAIIAPRALRCLRVTQRKRDDDAIEFFAKQDWREIDYGVANCIALADAYILNTGSLDEATNQLARLVEKKNGQIDQI